MNVKGLEICDMICVEMLNLNSISNLTTTHWALLAKKGLLEKKWRVSYYHLQLNSLPQQHLEHRLDILDSWRRKQRKLTGIKDYTHLCSITLAEH